MATKPPTKEDIARMFASDDPHEWNGGTWPPKVLLTRWHELFCAALSAQALRSTYPPHEFVSWAAEVADWALRMEVERGL